METSQYSSRAYYGARYVDLTNIARDVDLTYRADLITEQTLLTELDMWTLLTELGM